MTDEGSAVRDMFESVSLGSPDNAVGFVLWRVVHRYQRAIDQALQPLDLTHLQFTVLAMAGWLTKDGKSTSQSAIAQAAEIQPMQISHMVKALEGKGLVTRGRDAADGRSFSISLSPTGVNALREAMPIAIHVQQAMFGGDSGLLKNLRDVENQSPKDVS